MTTQHRGYLLQSLSHLAVNKTKVTDELAATVTTAQEVLTKATTVFPFTLFPDTIAIDRTNLTVTHRTFFKMATIITIKIDDVLNVTPNVGPFFGSLRIATAFVDDNSPYHINYLQREDALRIKRILQGYKVARQQKINTSMLSKEELVKLLDKLAQDGSETS